MRQLISDARLDGEVEIDSAGTAGWHIGDEPDSRSQAEATRRGLDLSSLRGRRVRPDDFDSFDLLIAMDRENAADLESRAPNDEARSKIHLLREFDPAAIASGQLDVPDPYYGGPDGFAHVFDVVEAACRGLLERIRRS
jgi:protein-tyrosine phosphatase